MFPARRRRGKPSNIDVAQNVWYVDGLAEGDAADWLDGNLVTTGTVFEGKFKLAYELIRKANRGIDGAEDAKLASLILLKGIRIVSRGLPISICGEDE